jgi:cell wall-associated NlpC family hydrolase
MNYTVEEVKEKRERIVAEAHKLIGVPFRHMGVTRFGVDCKGCGYLAYYKAGVPLPQGDGKIYEPNWFYFVDKERYLDGLLKFFQITKEPLPGDVVVFSCYSKLVTHGGIYIGENNFIHAPSRRKVTKESLDHKYWKSRFRGFLVYKGFLNNSEKEIV